MILLFSTFLFSAQAFFEFVPDDLITFEVKGHSAERFYENITSPTQIYGAFQVNQARETIDVQIKSPLGRTMYSRMNTTYGNFTLNATDIGLHEIVFNNRRKGNILLTFAMDVVNSDKEGVQSSDIDPLEVDLQSLQKGLYDIYYDQKFQQLKFDTSTQYVKDANKRIYIFTIIETIVIVLVTLWQIWYIKRLYNKRPFLLI